MIKGYLWTDQEGKLTYNASQDKDVSGMRSNCSEIGGINQIPEIPGVLVFMSGHVGVYIGGGKVIEARGHTYGVVMTNLSQRGWTHYGKLKWIRYEEEQKPEPTQAEKIKAIKEYFGFQDGTMQFISFYKHGADMINKLYAGIPK